MRAYADDWGKRYDANPGDKVASINYARALRALTRYGEAAAVMQAAAVKAPKDFEVLGAYGKALADDGQFEQAKEVLSRAYAPERPDWTIMSVQGSVADRLGDHEGAQKFYRDALKIAPGEPTVLTNLGLSYALTKQLPLAEEALRQACASPPPTRACATISRWSWRSKASSPRPSKSAAATCRPQAASANVRAIRQMIAQTDSWRDLQDRRKDEAAPRSPASPAAAPLAADQPAG